MEFLSWDLNHWTDLNEISRILFGMPAAFETQMSGANNHMENKRPKCMNVVSTKKFGPALLTKKRQILLVKQSVLYTVVYRRCCLFIVSFRYSLVTYTSLHQEVHKVLKICGISDFSKCPDEPYDHYKTKSWLKSLETRVQRNFE